MPLLRIKKGGLVESIQSSSSFPNDRQINVLTAPVSSSSAGNALACPSGNRIYQCELTEALLLLRVKVVNVNKRLKLLGISLLKDKLMIVRICLDTTKILTLLTSKNPPLIGSYKMLKKLEPLLKLRQDWLNKVMLRRRQYLKQ